MIRLYTADQHFISLNNTIVIRSVLNYGSHFASHRSPIADLLYANAWNGKGPASFFIPCLAGKTMLFLPLQEDIKIKYMSKDLLVQVGQLIILDVEHINELLIQPLVHNDEQFAFNVYTFTSSILVDCDCEIFDLHMLNAHNQLFPVLESVSTSLEMYVGTFMGKEEFDLALSAKFKHVFVSVLSGTFEVSERLMFTGDTLFSDEFTLLNIESLAETGIIMLLLF